MPFKSYRWLLSIMMGGLSLLAAACESISPWCGSYLATGCGEPHLCRDKTMMAMARDLDHLERHIDQYGSVTARAPSVWGEARLTRYRDEIEKILVEDTKKFDGKLQGFISRSDQSYLANATALAFAASPRVNAVPPPTTTKAASKTEYLTPPLVPTSREIVSQERDKDGNVVTTTKTTQAPAQAKPAPSPPTTPSPEKVDIPTLDDPFNLVADPNAEGSKIIQRSQVNIVQMPGFGGQFNDTKIGLEPVEFLNQKKRYLDYLAQLRRTNEGDDTADSPGYALNLLRIPVSVLPGKCTDTGHGAEITMTLTPDLGDELLPITFRTLVTNDIVKQFGFPLTKFLESKENRELLADPVMRLAVREIDILEDIVHSRDEVSFLAQIARLSPQIRIALKIDELLGKHVTAEDKQPIVKLTLDPIAIQNMRKGILPLTNGEFSVIDQSSGGPRRVTIKQPKQGETDSGKANARAIVVRVTKIVETANAVQVPFSTGTRGKQPVPASQFFDVHGATFPFEIGSAVSSALAEEIQNRGYVHLPDVQEVLKTEIDAAYRFLAQEASRCFWDAFGNQEIAKLVLNRNHYELVKARDRFRDLFAEVSSSKKDESNPDYNTQYSTTAALAWAILVDSALLNYRLINDIKDVATTKNVPLPAGVWLDYHTPHPSPEARKAFNDYVLARWPIRVFALDPETNDQNIADSLSVRREMQIAVSVAFASGNMRLRQFNQFVRRLEGDYQTIALNRTQIGFGHGANVFGWRFYPRFQTPSTPSNLTVIFRDQLIGGPSKSTLLRDQRIEPGPRECVALVIMPSFVSSATLDVNGNWFGLANPKHKVFDHTQSLRLSRTVQSIRTKGCEVVDAECYRDVDQKLLQTRAEQLSSRLPLQTMSAQIPTSENLAGYELFSHSTSDLAPQLYGWYGAPGVAEGATTDLFLVGDHFSVTQSQALAGNKMVASQTMISRQVMKITVAADSMVRSDNKVQINVATPYGVSQDLLVPLVAAKEICKTETNFPTKVEVIVERMCAGESKCRIINVNVEDEKAVAWLKWPEEKLPIKPVAATLTFPMKGCEVVIDQCCYAKLGGLNSYGQMIPLDKDALQHIANCLMGGLNNCGDCASIDELIAKGITTTSVKLSDGKSVKDSANQLTLTFKCRNRPGICPPGTDGPPTPAPMKKGDAPKTSTPVSSNKTPENSSAIIPQPNGLPQPTLLEVSSTYQTWPLTTTLRRVGSEKK